MAQQLSIDEALATQTLVFHGSKGRGLGIQCKFIRKDGSRCRKWAINGAFVCYRHGGQLLTVRQAANARKAYAANRAIATILDLVENGESEHVRLRAAKFLLRYAGVTPGTTRTAKTGKLRKQHELEPAPALVALDDQIEAALGQLKELEA